RTLCGCAREPRRREAEVPVFAPKGPSPIAGGASPRETNWREIPRPGGAGVENQDRRPLRGGNRRISRDTRGFRPWLLATAPSGRKPTPLPSRGPLLTFTDTRHREPRTAGPPLAEKPAPLEHGRMKVPLLWLAEYVSHNLPPAELARRLTMAGLEVGSFR